MTKIILILLGVFIVQCVSEAEIKREKEIIARKLPIIVRHHVSRPNSASGIDLIVHYKNLSKKDIKYAVFKFIPYNNVGDIQKSSIDGESEKSVKDVGPIKAGENKGNNRWGTVWYNYSIICSQLKEVKIIYMDNEEITIKNPNDILSSEQEFCPPKI